MAEESVEEQYLGYKRVVSKLGFEAAQAQYRQQYNQPIELSLLIEFHYLQHEIHQYRNDPDRATMSIRAGVQFLSKDAFIHDHAQGIVRTLDWFDTIESENEEQYEGLQCILPDAIMVYRTIRQQCPVFYENEGTAIWCHWEMRGKNWKMQLDIALRALVGLVGFFGIKLAYDEVTLCLTILRETRTERLVKLILCLALINAEAFLRQQKALDTALDQLLESKISDMPIKLIAYFRTDQISAVEDTIRSVLDMQIPIPKLGLFEMQKLISNRVIRS
ncbi:hypothetical protein EC973_006052 [Apophysomyces ossiformis]|uniref:Uncharacterized protein n=1 Tax=Apophysomyces ossiformis TaxID=679940 RepID=A0A8H7EUN7_9FUNG|nr:hypothetical protein EC973_006052 [Apophysomyces ossiformis]